MQCKDHGYRLGTVGYANVKYRGKIIGRHVVALIEATGEQPNGRFALHSCDNPRCVEPQHLRWGTPADNMRDKKERGRCNNGNHGGRRRNKPAPRILPSVDKLKEMRQDGMTLQQIASQYGVSRQAVSQALNKGLTTDTNAVRWAPSKTSNKRCRVRNTGQQWPTLNL